MLGVGLKMVVMLQAVKGARRSVNKQNACECESGCTEDLLE